MQYTHITNTFQDTVQCWLGAVHSHNQHVPRHGAMLAWCITTSRVPLPHQQSTATQPAEYHYPTSRVPLPNQPAVRKRYQVQAPIHTTAIRLYNIHANIQAVHIHTLCIIIYTVCRQTAKNPTSLLEYIQNIKFYRLQTYLQSCS